MTNPLPESAVELAARAIFAWALPKATWDTSHENDSARQAANCMARAALTAALPAIREAVVGELAGLSNELDNITQEVEHAGIAGRIGDIASRLAALTEQENRNG